MDGCRLSVADLVGKPLRVEAHLAGGKLLGLGAPADNEEPDGKCYTSIHRLDADWLNMVISDW